MLHYLLPQPPREGVRFVACVGVIVGFNNRMRCFSVFEREARPPVRITSDQPMDGRGTTAMDVPDVATRA